MAVKLKSRAAVGHLPKGALPQLVNSAAPVSANRAFQRWLDKSEIDLFSRVWPVLLTGAQSAYDQSPFKAEAYLKQTLAPIFLNAYRRIYYEGYQMVDLSTTPATKEASGDTIGNFLQAQLDALTTQSIQLSGDVSASLISNIRSKLLEGVRAGWSNDKIATELRKAIPTLTKSQAATIARTEVHTAAVKASATALAFKKIKVKTKTWWSSRDNKVRETHAELHGTTIPADEPFVSSSGAKLRYPGDSSLGADGSETINCRCAVLWNTEFASSSTPTPVGAGAVGAQPTPAPVGVPQNTPRDVEAIDYFTSLRAGQSLLRSGGTELEDRLSASHTKLPGFIDEFENKLPEGQRYALDRYVGSGHRGMNRYLRETMEELLEAGYDEDQIRDYARDVGLMDEVMTPLQTATTVYRGTNLSARNGALSIGDEFTEEGFLSTSRNPSISVSFAKKAKDFGKEGAEGWADLLQIDLPNGTQAIVTNKYEAEVILKHGTKFRVVDRILVDDEMLKQDALHGIRYIYKVEIVEQEAKPFELIPEL